MLLKIAILVNQFEITYTFISLFSVEYNILIEKYSIDANPKSIFIEINNFSIQIFLEELLPLFRVFFFNRLFYKTNSSNICYLCLWVFVVF